MPNPDVLTFTTHSMAIACYQVSDVHMVYAGSERVLWVEDSAPAKRAGDKFRYPNVTFGSYLAFSGPVHLRWRCAHGAQHQAHIDLDTIFPARQVLHTEAPERVYGPMPVTGGEPIILVELADRTINIFMLASIQLVTPGGGARDERDHCTLAFSCTF